MERSFLGNGFGRFEESMRWNGIVDAHLPHGRPFAQSIFKLCGPLNTIQELVNPPLRPPGARLLNCEEYCEVQQALTSAARRLRKMELEMVSLASLAAPLPFDHAPRARVSRCTLLMHAGHKPLDAQSCKTPARVVRNDPGG